jgi:prevent-host-death family protein
MMGVLMEMPRHGGHDRIIPVSDLRRDAARILKSVRSSQQPVVITQRGRASAVMISAEAYWRSAHERKLLLQMARGEKETSKGAGYDLDRVLAEADDLLAAD